MSNWLSHGSFLGHLGGYGDRILNPISWVTGGKSTHLTSDVLPEKVNAGLSAVMRPFDKIDQTVNPVRKIHIVDRAANITKAKPGDALAIAAGAVFGGAAALGGGAGAGAGAGAGGGAAAGGGVADVGGLAALDSGAVASEGAAPALMGGGGAAAGGGVADVGGLASADSAAVDAEGAEPGLTQGYGPVQSAPSSASQFQQGGGQQQQEDPRKRPLDQLPIIQQPTLEQREAALMVDSSRKLKTAPGPVSMQAIVHAGASGADQITENGVHIGAIRALHTKIANLEAIAKQRGITV